MMACHGIKSALVFKLWRSVNGAILRFLMKGITQHAVMGFSVCDINANPYDDNSFLARTTEALILIRDTDPRRFARVQCSIDYFLNTEHCGGGAYYPGNICIVDFGRYNFDSNERWTLYQYAAMIIHEATHGVIRATRIPRTNSNWIQMERICRAEQNRFLAKLEPLYGGPLQRPFNPEDWMALRSPSTRRKIVRERRQEEKLKVRR
jgi:hypothetical protein